GHVRPCTLSPFAPSERKQPSWTRPEPGTRSHAPPTRETDAPRTPQNTRYPHQVPDPRPRHRLSRGPDRASDRANHLPYRALQDPPQGPPLAPRPASHGLQATTAPR